MPELDVESIVDRMSQIGLISRDQLIQAREGADDGSPDALVRFCLRRGWITSWQLDRLKKGDASSFFFGPYRALFHLAEGTFARVYRGERSNTGEAVAIKVLRGRFAADPDAVASFRKEAEAGMRLQHDNIVHILDFGDSDGKNYMIMEYVEGMNLRQLLQLRQHLSGKEALPLMLDLAEGLAYAHDNGVGHRDLKATNVLISNSGVAKLVDFGLANIQVEDGKGGHGLRTVDYSALERSCGSPKGDARSDIYFLGCVFYYMLTGQVPLEDSESKDPLKKMLKRSFSIIRPISELRNAPDPALSQIVEKMMKMDLRARYQTIDQVVADLEAYRDGKFGNEEGEVEEEPDLDPELGSALFRNPFLPIEPEASEDPIPAPATVKAPDRAPTPILSHGKEEEEGAVALELDRSESAEDVETDLGALLGLTADADAEAPEVIPDAEPESRPAAKVVEPAPPAEKPRPAPRPTILCVEPLEDIQEVLRKSLTRRGYRVLIIADAEQAVARFKEKPADVVLFDVDGLGPAALPYLEAIQAKARKRAVPFRALILLGPRQEALKEKLPTADQRVVLSKPMKLKDLMEGVESLVPKL